MTRTQLRAAVVSAWWLTPGATSASIAQKCGSGIAAVNIWKPKNLNQAPAMTAAQRLSAAIAEVWGILEEPTAADVAASVGCTEAQARSGNPNQPVEKQPEVDAYELLHKAIAEAWRTIEDPTAYKVAEAIGCTPHIALQWKPKLNKKVVAKAPGPAPRSAPRPGTKTAQIVEAMQSGEQMTAGEMAERFEVERAQVYQIMKKWVPDWTPARRQEGSSADAPRPGSKTADVVEAMLSDKDYTAAELADAFEITRPQIYQIAKRWAPDWEPRKRESWGKKPKAGKAVAAPAPAAKAGKTSKKKTPEPIAEPEPPAPIRSALPKSALARAVQNKAAKQAAAAAVQKAAPAKPAAPAQPAAKAAPAKAAPAKAAPSKVAAKISKKAASKTGRTRAPAEAPREGTITASIVADWNAGLVNNPNEAANRYGVKWETAAKALLRWTDYNGQAR